MRKPRKFDVQVMAEDGEQKTVQVGVFWKDGEGFAEAVGWAGAGKAFMESGRTKKFKPVAVSPA
jgi:hypothetical protein